MDTKIRAEIVLAAQKIIFGQEGNYGSVNANDKGAVSVGKVQWHAGRALALLKKICAAESGAASILGAALYQEITTAATDAWNTRTVNTTEKAAISKLLSTDAGKRVQDAQAETDVGAYVDRGLKVGVEDPAALVYFADMENQGGGGASARVASAAKKPVTLDTLHAAGLADKVMGTYSTRRKTVYEAAKKLVWGGTPQKGETKMNKKPVSYLQTDSRWKNKPYRVTGESATIGGSGCGPTAAANALMEQEVAVRMTNFALILNDLNASFEGRNDYIDRLCRAPLLIIDDFGMERGTEYGLEQVYNVIDSRYRSKKPLIVTTNIPLQDLQHPQDTAHARIYDRLLEMCAPVRFSGENFRKATAQDKLARLKILMD